MQLPLVIEIDQTTDPRFPQRPLGAIGVDFHPPLNGCDHIHFKLEMHTTAEVQAQLHGLPAQITQPVRRGGRQVQGHDKAIAKSARYPCLGRQLHLVVFEANQGIAAIRGDNFTKIAYAGLIQG